MECWPGGQFALADTIKRSAIFDEFKPILTVLAEEFADIDSAGAVKYGRFIAADATTSDRFAQRAVGAMRALLAALVSQEHSESDGVI